MPTVPTYTRVATNNQLPGVMATASGDQNAFGANIAHATDNLSGALMQVGEQINNQQVETQHQANLTAVQNALDGATKEINDYHYNQNDGYLHRQGTNAQGITNLSKDMNNAVIYKYSQNLTNDVQKQAFQQAMSPHLEALKNATMNHEYEQNTIATKQSGDALASTYANTAATAYNNPDVADNAFRMGIKTRMASGMALGQPKEVIQQSIQKYSGDVVSQMVQTALASNDIDGAKKVVERYADKLDASTISTLTGAINKKSVPIQARKIADEYFTNYGLDKEKEAFDDLRKNYGNDPGFKSYYSQLESRYNDERRFKSQADKKYEEDVLGSVLKAGTLEEAKNIIDNSNLKPSQKIYMLNQKKAALKAASGPADTESKRQEKHWANYELSGGLERHLLQLREYYTKVQNGDQITPEQQTKYDYAAYTVTKYKEFKSNGGFDPEAEDWKQTFDNDSSHKYDNVTSGKAEISQDEYDKLKSDGYSDDEINEKYDITE